jgi:hypothetical protein
MMKPDTDISAFGISRQEALRLISLHQSVQCRSTEGFPGDEFSSKEILFIVVAYQPLPLF